VTGVEIVRVGAEHVDELLPLMGAYCEFYEVAPGEPALRGLAQALLADPERAGIQLLARERDGTAVGFATIFWTFSTLRAAPIGLMNDLYVAPAARGRGIGRALIDACAAQCARRGVAELEWNTAPSNERAQSVYDATGAVRTLWVNYSLAVG
jgi:GNAT superfamily N-acetyltransferase